MVMEKDIYTVYVYTVFLVIDIHKTLVFTHSLFREVNEIANITKGAICNIKKYYKYQVQKCEN